MIVVRASDLAGMPLAALRQVLGIPAEELVVVIQTLDHGDRIGTGVPPEDPLAGPVHLQEAPGVPQVDRQGHQKSVLVHDLTEGRRAIPLPVIDGRSTDFKSVAGVNASSPKAPPENNPFDVSLPSCGSAVVVDAGGAGGHIDDRPPRLPEDGRGVTYAQLIEAAESVRMSVRLGISGSVVVLCDPLGGSTTYPDWPSAIRVINARWDYDALGYARGVIGG